jgi:uncharacterized protein YjbI with pentapeptide repeats/beta-lactamase regulating signal transducer with metallopeptidase domain
MNALLVVLINGLWQGAAIAALTWLALRLFPKANASTRYAAWTVALLAVVLVPVLTSMTVSAAASSAVRGTVSPSARNSLVKLAPGDTVPRSSERSASTNAAGAHGPSRSELKQETANGARGRVPQLAADATLVVNLPLYITAAIFTLWGIAAFVLVLRLAVALVRLEKLKRDALPLPIEQRESMAQWQSLSQRDRDVRICVTERIEVPVAVGLFDAMVLLPKELLADLDADELDQISLHELAHLLRHDDWTNGFQRVVSALLFFNPAVWFIARQMDVEREVACDDYVLELTGAVRSYAFCLTKMAERTAWPHQPLAAPGVFTTRKGISIRIERLLRTGRAIGSQISPPVAIAVVVGLLGGYAIARVFTPTVAFAMPALQVAVATPSPVPQVHVNVPPVHVDMPATHVDVPAVHVDVSAIHVAVPETHVDIPPVHVDVPKMNVVAQAGLTCDGCEFAGKNLAGKSFDGSMLEGSDFHNANLNGASFRGANLTGSDFRGADLRNANFTGANLEGADLSKARLAGADFTSANMTGTDIDARGLDARAARQYLAACTTGCDLHGANLRGADLRGLKLEGVDFSGADLRGADLDHSEMTGVDFSKADLRGASMNDTRFSGCDFTGALLGKL